MLTKEMLSYIAENIEDIKRIIRDLCAIPAPSHHEEKRAEYCKAWFRANGFEDVEIDEALNVVCRYQVTDENDLVVFMAHTDTVFPDTEPMPFREDEKKMYAPGVCDDTANLAVMMVSARYFVQRKLRAKCGLLFVANSCEEGLGNLKGSRRIIQDYGSRIREFYTFDGTNLRRVVTSAVGSHRYRVTVRTEGGHSYGAFGNRNAIYYLSSIINTIYTMKVPQKEGVKTTYNVGVIEGGTSVNTIAQADITKLDYPDGRFDAVVAANVIHLLDEPLQALRELDRVCRPGGRLIIPTYMNRTDKGTTNRVSGAIGRAGADFKREFTLESYQAFFAAAGYTDARYTLCEGRIPCAVAVLQKRKEATA